MKLKTIPMLCLFLLVLLSCSEARTDSNANHMLTADQQQPQDTAGLTIATFAGGCFWCTEGYFESLKGIKHVESGYTGGKKPNPTYEEVSRGNSGYAEAVQIYYDPKILSFQELLEVFFATHDPTTLNRQGPDVGEQYRSAVFYHNQEQKQLTEKYINQLNLKGTYTKKIVTAVEPFTTFWVAEEYHQDFYKRNPNNPYIKNVMQPKMKKLETTFKDKLKQ
ncbi:peptide-methionine (S)-S-oxide reductase MsrA [Pontibacter qinzhouensis]|uniref:Peptide methionine sulfoxide reductase MsrA n=1 Tax=Pontibacter qinzhouensis TaxID=2603253 RepID=A0A5C8JDI0_9BACT|nr:peptide-methionine (S)-S-oxide reductase MsrA [Pontibacter qinzhouensis]TXK36420.1 peptide-methionine (S)-S-oxide reductase MsrA [Pontibacter qinzhouensis]